MDHLEMIDKKRDIKLPKEKSNELAEFFGILAGDGHVSFKSNDKYNYEISIAGHSIDDKEYHINYILPLFKRLFGLEPKIIHPPYSNVSYLRVRSKTIINFIKMNNYYKLNGEIRIPSWIFRKSSYTRSFIRGITDTDGSLAVKKKYRKRPYYPTINISSKNKKLIEKISNFLRKDSFKLWCGTSSSYYNYKGLRLPCMCYRVELNGFENLLLWRQNISFSNQKHLTKYKYVIKEKFGTRGNSRH